MFVFGHAPTTVCGELLYTEDIDPSLHSKLSYLLSRDKVIILHDEPQTPSIISFPKSIYDGFGFKMYGITTIFDNVCSLSDMKYIWNQEFKELHKRRMDGYFIIVPSLESVNTQVKHSLGANHCFDPLSDDCKLVIQEFLDELQSKSNFEGKSDEEDVQLIAHHSLLLFDNLYSDVTSNVKRLSYAAHALEMKCIFLVPTKWIFILPAKKLIGIIIISHASSAADINSCKSNDVNKIIQALDNKPIENITSNLKIWLASEDLCTEIVDFLQPKLQYLRKEQSQISQEMFANKVKKWNDLKSNTNNGCATKIQQSQKLKRKPMNSKIKKVEQQLEVNEISLLECLTFDTNSSLNDIQFSFHSSVESESLPEKFHFMNKKISKYLEKIHDENILHVWQIKKNRNEKWMDMCLQMNETLDILPIDMKTHLNVYYQSKCIYELSIIRTSDISVNIYSRMKEDTILYKLSRIEKHMKYCMKYLPMEWEKEMLNKSLTATYLTTVPFSIIMKTYFSHDQQMLELLMKYMKSVALIENWFYFFAFHYFCNYRLLSQSVLEIPYELCHMWYIDIYDSNHSQSVLNYGFLNKNNMKSQKKKTGFMENICPMNEGYIFYARLESAIKKLKDIQMKGSLVLCQVCKLSNVPADEDSKSNYDDDMCVIQQNFCAMPLALFRPNISC